MDGDTDRRNHQEWHDLVNRIRGMRENYTRLANLPDPPGGMRLEEFRRYLNELRGRISALELALDLPYMPLVGDEGYKVPGRGQSNDPLFDEMVGRMDRSHHRGNGGNSRGRGPQGNHAGFQVGGGGDNDGRPGESGSDGNPGSPGAGANGGGFTISGPDSSTSRSDYESHKDKKDSNGDNENSTGDKKDPNSGQDKSPKKDPETDKSPKKEVESDKPPPKETEGLPRDDGSGGGGNDVGGRSLPKGGRDNRSGLEQMRHPEVRVVGTKNGADDKQRPDVGAAQSAVPQRSGEPGSINGNDLRGRPNNGAGGAQVPGIADRLWWYIWGTRAQPRQ